MKALSLILLVIFFCFTFGCTSVPLKVSTLQNLTANKDYEVLGQGIGDAVGIMLFQLIPIGQNDRFEKAYEEAVKSKGGDRLIDPIITERWFWAWILNGYITTVKGTVVKDIRK